ncbi:olfactory receptor 14I1-like [Anser cygnoides]|uniref:olfactory receptor 14I1-like n=1 Tax=Anser cygnoides TaxID=8845 RepID=UPI0034D38FD6
MLSSRGPDQDNSVQSQQMPNISSVNKFFLMAFADTQEFQLLHFRLFLGIYLAALLGNGLILTAVACDHHLHTPMYFFLLNLALLDLGSISITVPKAMANSLWENRAISYQGCAAQLFLFAFFVVAEYCLLTVMAYDRYVAICKPLHYGSLLGSRACAQMATAAWGWLSQCCPAHGQYIFLNALPEDPLPSYLKPPSISSPTLDLVVAVLYSLVPPAMNPLIYSMRNKELKEYQKMPNSSSVSEFHLLASADTWELQLQHFRLFLGIYLAALLAEFSILTIMSYDRYIAICKPLHYGSLLGSTACAKMAAAAWGMTFLYSVVPPAVNPLIYSMRNQELKDAVRNLFG